MAAAMAKTLPKEIIPRFGLPGFLQSHTGPSFVSSDKGDNECPEHKMELPFSLETPTDGESREIQSDLETSLGQAKENWTKLVQTALLSQQLAPRCKFKLSAFELVYGRPISQPETGHLSPPEMKPLKYAFQVGETMKSLIP